MLSGRLERNTSLLALTLAFGVTGREVHAQDAATNVAAAATPSDEITVTARKREERLIDVPVSITVFTGENVDRLGITSIKDVALRVPNFSIVEAQQPGVSAITIRGIGQVRNGEAPIAVVIDGVQLNSPNQITQDLLDIERIEVLKGPQGATYGRNAVGGAINIVTRQPANMFEGWAQGSYGSGENFRGSAAISGPIIEDKLLFRISGLYGNMSGDIDNLTLRRPVNFNETKNIRALLIAKPTDRVDIDLRYSRLDTNAGAAWYTLVPPSTSINAVLPVTGDRLGRSKRLLDDTSLKVDVSFDTMRLTSITAYSEVASDLDEDFDFTPLDLLSATQTQRTKAWSQELRLASEGKGPFTWLAGAYYLKTDQRLDSEIFLRPGSSGILVPFPIPAPALFSATRSTDDNKAYAIFGQAAYRFDNGFELSLGLRQDWDDRIQLDRMSGQRFSRLFKSFQPKFQLSYHANSNATIFASAGKGFRSGGFNPSPRIARVFDKEEAWSYELGAKASLLGGTLTLDGAAFVTDVDNRQVYNFDLLAATQTITNPIQKAQIRGIELAMALRPVTGLDLGASVGLLDTEIKRYDTSVFAGLPAAGDFTGNNLPQTAYASFNVNAQYTYSLDTGLALSLFGELNSSGGNYFWEIDNLDRRSRITLANVRLTGSYGKLRVTAFVDNVLNERYVLEYLSQRFSGAPLGNYSIPAPGRRGGVQARYQF